jgi:hypothetical protein
LGFDGPSRAAVALAQRECSRGTDVADALTKTKETAMAFRFTEQHAMTLVGPNLYPGEQVLHRATGVERPWYSRIFFRIGALFWRYYLVVATNQRILFVQHKTFWGRYAAKRVDALAWGEVERATLGWGVFQKKLAVRAPARGFAKSVHIQRFWLKGNFDGARGIIDTWQRRHVQLAAGAAAPQLGT